MKVVARNERTSRVESVACRFCVAFGREEAEAAGEEIERDEELDDGSSRRAADGSGSINESNVGSIDDVIDDDGRRRKKQR